MYLYKFKLYVLKSKQENEFGSPETKLILLRDELAVESGLTGRKRGAGCWKYSF